MNDTQRHIHILGICGTFMGGVAQLALQAGYCVSGCDQNVYPPMSDQLRDSGAELSDGFNLDAVSDATQAVVIGNVMRRGQDVVEAVLNRSLPYCSGPEWLYQHILSKRTVIAVAGTHGKTTTTSLLVSLLHSAGIDCGYLIGGVAQGFEQSAYLGSHDLFVIEADEYDSAFFDKRSKFLHYRPTHLIFNNLEFDHADIFKDLEAIQWQFEQLLRLIPGEGQVVYPADDQQVVAVLDRGCWSQQSSWGQHHGETRWRLDAEDGSRFSVQFESGEWHSFAWSMLGEHNVKNATAALLMASHLGLTLEQMQTGIRAFAGVKRRMELVSSHGGVYIYDDFAHHPTAIAHSIGALRQHQADVTQRVIAVLEFASYTMKSGKHASVRHDLFSEADAVFAIRPAADWAVDEWFVDYAGDCALFDEADALFAALIAYVKPGDRLLIMSNRSFSGLHQRLRQYYEQHQAATDSAR